MRRNAARLEAHRLRFHRDGRRGPLLSLHQLTDAERSALREEFLREVGRLRLAGPLDEEGYGRAYLEVLSDWGVACGHPGHTDSRAPCPVCGCLVFRPPGRQRATG